MLILYTKQWIIRLVDQGQFRESSCRGWQTHLTASLILAVTQHVWGRTTTQSTGRRRWCWTTAGYWSCWWRRHSEERFNQDGGLEIQGRGEKQFLLIFGPWLQWLVSSVHSVWPQCCMYIITEISVSAAACCSLVPRTSHYPVLTTFSMQNPPPSIFAYCKQSKPNMGRVLR